MKIALRIPDYGDISNGLPIGVPTGGLDTTARNVISVFLTCLITGAVIFTIYQLLTGGISIIMSKGNKERFQKGRDKVFHALIGLIVVFLSILMVKVLEFVVGAPLLFFYQ